MAADGTIYFGSRDRKFYALTPQGKLKWTFADRRVGGFVAGHRGGRHGLFRLVGHEFLRAQSRRTMKWNFATGGIVDSSPAIGADGTIYFGSHDKYFYALTPDGAKKWKFATGAQITASPAIAADGTIYFSSTDGNFYALSPDGTERGGCTRAASTKSSPVLDQQGMIYLTSNIGRPPCSAEEKALGLGVTRFTSLTLQRRWRRTGSVYFPAPWRDLIAFGPAGTTLAVALDTAVSVSPAIGDNGTIYRDGRKIS